MKRVLVVDDDDSIRRLVRRALGPKLGSGDPPQYEIIEARDGAEALEMLRVDPGFHVLLTDVNMPRMGGFVLVAALPSTDFDGVVVMMTGRLDEAEQRARIEAFVESGEVRAFFGKPCTPQQVRDAVTRALEFVADRDRIDARHRDSSG